MVMAACFAAAIWGYASDERSSLGERGERRRWREERPERVAAVYIFKAALTAAENIGHRNRVDTQNRSLQMSVTRLNNESCLRNQKERRAILG